MTYLKVCLPIPNLLFPHSPSARGKTQAQCRRKNLRQEQQSVKQNQHADPAHLRLTDKEDSCWRGRPGAHHSTSLHVWQRAITATATVWSAVQPENPPTVSKILIGGRKTRRKKSPKMMPIVDATLIKVAPAFLSDKIIQIFYNTCFTYYNLLTKILYSTIFQ